EAYLPLIKDAGARALAAAGVDKADHVIVSSPHARAAAAGAKHFGSTQTAPAIGYSGAADPGVRLAAVLDAAAPGETILLVVAADHLAFSPAPPMINAVVDFEGGGRYTLEVADADPDEVAIGTPLELTFRRLYTVDGVHNYFWKVRPVSG